MQAGTGAGKDKHKQMQGVEVGLSRLLTTVRPSRFQGPTLLPEGRVVLLAKPLAREVCMSRLEHILQVLEKWPTWERMREAPDRVDALEKRLAELEGRLAPGEACPTCGAPELRVVGSRSALGVAGTVVGVNRLQCAACGFEEERTVKPE